MDLRFEFFEFRNRTRVMYGVGCYKDLAFELEALGVKRAFICTDGGLRDAGILDRITATFEGSAVELAGVYDGIIQDARVAQINEAAKMVRETRADGVVALGGGSVMDSVKAILHMIRHGGEDFQEILENPNLDFKPLMPHIAIPTTSGTGCEVTHAAVIYDEKNKSKGGFIDVYCSSDVTLLDPEMTVGLPPRITAFTGGDALTHAVEGYVSTMNQPIADAMNLHAIRIIAQNLPKVVENGEDIVARGQMAIAACLAGMGFIQTNTGAVHATSHALGGRFGVPHGLANSMMLPWVMEANLEACPERYRDIAQAMGEKVDGLPVEEAARRAVERTRDLLKAVGLTDALRDFGVTEEKMEEVGLVELAMTDAQMGFNPRSLGPDDVWQMYMNAL